MSEHKAFTGVEVKDAEQGRVEAVFASYNVKDHDGDVTMPGAFEDGAAVRISAYGHASWGPGRGSSSVPMMPVGKGVIRVDGDDAVLDGQFFLKTQAGRDTFEVVKEMGSLQEWSYGFDVLDSEQGNWEGEPARFLKRQRVHEVSPVLIGAGFGTHTIAVKSAAEMSFAEEADHALGSVEAFINRAQSLGSLRAEQKESNGRVLNEANREKLKALQDSLGQQALLLDELLKETDPNKDRDRLLAEIFRFELQRHNYINAEG